MLPSVYLPWETYCQICVPFSTLHAVLLLAFVSQSSLFIETKLVVWISVTGTNPFLSRSGQV